MQVSLAYQVEISIAEIVERKDLLANLSRVCLVREGRWLCRMMVTQIIGYSRADSPAGLAAWFYDKFSDWTYTGSQPERALTRDEMLDDIALYWLADTGTSSAQLYWEITPTTSTRWTSPSLLP